MFSFIFLHYGCFNDINVGFRGYPLGHELAFASRVPAILADVCTLCNLVLHFLPHFSHDAIGKNKHSQTKNYQAQVEPDKVGMHLYSVGLIQIQKDNEVGDCQNVEEDVRVVSHVVLQSDM